jgi:hypothetical protein
VLRTELRAVIRKRKPRRGWDSNRGTAGDMFPAWWGVYEGAGPLCKSARSHCERDIECPPSPPHRTSSVPSASLEG